MSSGTNLTILPSSVSKYGYLYKQEMYVKITKTITSEVQLQVLPTYGANPGGGQIFRTRPDRPWGPSNLLYNRYRFCPGGRAARAWHWPPTPRSSEVKERVELYLYAPSRPFWPVLRWTLRFAFTFTGTNTSPAGVWCNSVRMSCKRGTTTKSSRHL